MYAIWPIWALIIGGIATISTDDWNRIVDKKMVRRFLAFLFIGIAIPILSTIAWPPVNDDLWLPRMLLGIYACLAAFAVGFFVMRFFQWLLNNHKLMCAIGRHQEYLVEEFPSDVTTILGVECTHCHRPRCTINTHVPRYPSASYGKSVDKAKAWLEGKLGGKVSIPFVQFR